ncbi:hypothetical protein FACS1894167_08300 [Synergistales bacterium]|nr:hypothetical protein FACS1894167_08300 [Synergistales bacterium]GHV55268.1 hypothetical protein FACS1894216_17150 [Synergistales bacterium]
MIIRLDGTEVFLPGNITEAGKEAIYEEVQRMAGENGAVIKDILVDGESIYDTNAFFAIAGGVDIDFTSQNVLELAEETLAEGDRYIPVLEAGISDIATLFEQGQDGEARSKLAHASEGIEWLTSVLLKLCICMSIKPGELKAGNYEEYVAKLRDALDGMMTSIEEGKLLRTAYLMRGELLPLIINFADYWNEVKEKAELEGRTNA